jgi:hypothetical protein
VILFGGSCSASDYATYQELEISGIKLLFRYDQCYRFIDIPATFLPIIRRRALRLRPNIFLISSLLLTPAFFWLSPSIIQCCVSYGPETMTQTAGLASLTVIIVALIVIWTWLVAGNRVAWVIIAVIVWVWAFPIMMLPLVTHKGALSLSDLSDWVASAWHGDHLSRIALANSVLFLLMLVGLILPVRALFRIRKPA